MFYKKLNVRTKPVGKNFGDDLDDDVEKTNKPEFIDQRSTLCFQDESNQCIIEVPKIHCTIVELAK